MGRGVRRLPGEGRLHQADRGTQTKVRSKRAVKTLIPQDRRYPLHVSLRISYSGQTTNRIRELKKEISSTLPIPKMPYHVHEDLSDISYKSEN